MKDGMDAHVLRKAEFESDRVDLSGNLEWSNVSMIEFERRPCSLDVLSVQEDQVTNLKVGCR
jgi:hypothetical protein